MSCSEISSALFARTTPVSPPTVKRKRKPKTQRMVAFNGVGVPCMVASQEKILIPVGIAIINVAEVK